MSNLLFNTSTFCVSGTPEKSSESFTPISLPQSSDLAQSRKTIRVPPGFDFINENGALPSRSTSELMNEEIVQQHDRYSSKSIESFSSDEIIKRPVQNQIFPFSPRFGGKYFSHDHYPRPYYRFRYRHFGQGYNRPKQFQKSAYILSSIKMKYFKELGAVEYTRGIYLIIRQYEPENSSQETCATLGLSKQWVRQLPYRFSHLYDILRTLPVLQQIPGIQDLNPYKLHVLKNLMKYVNEMEDDELVLLNIEPKGQTDRSQHYYPTANICLPGGGMETEDEFDWKRTAFREFEEETGFTLDEQNIQVIDQQKWNSFNREIMYIVLKINKLISKDISDGCC